MSKKYLPILQAVVLIISSVTSGAFTANLAQAQTPTENSAREWLASAIKQHDGRGTVTERQIIAPDTVVSEVAPADFAEKAAATERRAAIAAGPAVKIAVRVTGWQRVAAVQLFAAGLAAGTNTTLLQLYADGVEQPLAINTTDGARLGANGSISFYGRNLDTRETDTRIYWLVVGTQPGLRFGPPRVIAPGPLAVEGTGSVLTAPDMLENRATGNKCTVCGDAENNSNAKNARPQTTLAPNPVNAPASFPFTLERREHRYYLPTIQNGPDEGNFFGAVVNGAGATQVLSLPQLDTNSNDSVNISVTLQGATITAHQVGVSFNDEFIGYTPYFYNQAAYTYRFSVPQSLLQAGDNTLTFTAANGNDDISFVDSVRVTYQRLYVAENNRLLFSTGRARNLSVRGFTASDIQVYDLTDPRRGFAVAARVRTDGAGYRVDFTGVLDNRVVLVVAGSAGFEPSAVVANEVSNLRDNENGADFLIIAPQAFRAAVGPLAQLRSGQGWRTQVIALEDIYDEWSDGAKSVTALRAFFAYTQQQWRRAPRAVLLVGDASYDPRDFLQRGVSDFVPTTYTVTDFLETASDALLADFNNDGIEDFALGRLPVRSATETAQMIAKIVAYQPFTGPRPDLLLVTDHADDNFFEDDHAELRATLPAGVPWREIRRIDQPDNSTMRNQVLAGLNQGPAIVEYAGHGVVEGWSTAGYVTSPDAAQLINNNRLSIVLTMSCLNGYFHDLDSQSLAEAFLRAPNGAVAVWASSALTYASGQKPMSQEWFRQVYSNGPAPVLGVAVRHAKIATLDLDVRRTWILFGDPTMPVRQ